MSRLLYTVKVQFEVEATDTQAIDESLSDLAKVGSIIETKAKAISAKKEKAE